jgi:hypothetical protein
MKVINPDILKVNHPSNWEVEQKHIGKSKNRILRVKNFFVNPEEIRAYALATEYVSTLMGEHTNLPGYIHNIGLPSKQLHEPFSYLCKTYFGASKSLMAIPAYSTFTFQMYEVFEKCRLMSLIPHTDDTHYACVMSLNTLEESEGTHSGTAFFRYEETDEEFLASDRNYRVERVQNKIQAMVNFDPSSLKLKDWDRYHIEPHEYNTLVLYEGKLWHSPYYIQEHWKANRLTFNAFLK